MKKEKLILVAIDFSKCSIKALEYAICFANEMNSNILMVYVDKPQSTESVYSRRGSEYMEKINKLFEKTIKKYQSQLKGKLDYKIRKGKVYVEICNQAKYSDAQIIVAGTHGVSGFEEFWIGSNAYKIVTYATCPVITIRESFIWNHKHIKKIILPIDSSMETRQKVKFTTELAKCFNSEVHVLGVYSTTVKEVKNIVESYSKQALDYIEQAGVKCERHFKSCENITDGVIEYAKENRAELIAIMTDQVMTDQEKSPKNLWLGAYAQQMVNHSPIPVLSIQSKAIYDEQVKAV